MIDILGPGQERRGARSMNTNAVYMLPQHCSIKPPVPTQRTKSGKNVQQDETQQDPHQDGAARRQTRGGSPGGSPPIRCSRQ